MTRFAILLSLAVLLGCGSDPPHSLYFVVTFLPKTPVLSEAGKAALDNAVRQAKDDRPGLVEISAVTPTGAASDGIEQQRADFIAQSMRAAGVREASLHIELRPADAKEYAPRKDTLLIRVGYGVKPGE